MLEADQQQDAARLAGIIQLEGADIRGRGAARQLVPELSDPSRYVIGASASRAGLAGLDGFDPEDGALYTDDLTRDASASDAQRPLASLGLG